VININKIIEQVKQFRLLFNKFELEPEEIGLRKIAQLKPHIMYFRTRFQVMNKVSEIRAGVEQGVVFEVRDESAKCFLTAWGTLGKKIKIGQSYELVNFKTSVRGSENNLYIQTLRVSELIELDIIYDETNIVDAKFKEVAGVPDKNKLPYDTEPFERDLYVRYINLKKIVNNYYSKLNELYDSENEKNPKSKYTQKQIEKLKDRAGIEESGDSDYKISILGRAFSDLTFRVCLLGNIAKHYVKVTGNPQESLNILLVCPELENICDLTLWVRGESKKYNEFEKVIIDLIEDNLGNNNAQRKYGKLSNYKLKLPNKILRQSSEITSDEIGGYFYWYLVPFLKSSINNILQNYDSLNYTVYTDNAGNDVAFIPKAICGIFTGVQGTAFSMLVAAEDGFLNEIWIYTVDKEDLNNIIRLNKGDVISCLIGCYPNEKFKLNKVLLKFENNNSDGTSFDEFDILDDAIKRILYQKMLNTEGVYCCSIDQVKDDIKRFMYHFQNGYLKFIGKRVNLGQFSLDKMMSYLSLYFQIYDNKIYYIPKLLNKYRKDIAEIDNYLVHNDYLDLDLKVIAERFRLIKNIKRLGERIS